MDDPPCKKFGGINCFLFRSAGTQNDEAFPCGTSNGNCVYGEWAEGETLVEFIADKSSSEVNFSEFISIGFAVDSIDEMLDTVKGKNIPVHSGPFDVPGASYFCIKDPNGLILQLFQQK